MSMVTIGAKIPPSWKELIQKLAREKGLEESEVIRQFLRVGMKHTDEVNGELSELVKEGEIVMKARRTLFFRRAIGHFGGHQSGWRQAAERIEDPAVQKAYLEISEKMRKEIIDFVKERERTKGKPTLLELLWDTRCQGCSYRIRRDRDFCEENCRMYKETKDGFELAKRRMVERKRMHGYLEKVDRNRFSRKGGR